MGVEILCGVDQATKSLPSCQGLPADQGVVSELALPLHVRVAFSKAAIVEVILRMTDQATRAVLRKVGFNDGLQGMKTHCPR